jgi:hypothetical protein
MDRTQSGSHSSCPALIGSSISYAIAFDGGIAAKSATDKRVGCFSLFSLHWASGSPQDQFKDPPDTVAIPLLGKASAMGVGVFAGLTPTAPTVSTDVEMAEDEMNALQYPHSRNSPVYPAKAGVKIDQPVSPNTVPGTC